MKSPRHGWWLIPALGIPCFAVMIFLGADTPVRYPNVQLGLQIYAIVVLVVFLISFRRQNRKSPV